MIIWLQQGVGLLAWERSDQALDFIKINNQNFHMSHGNEVQSYIYLNEATVTETNEETNVNVQNNVTQLHCHLK